MRNPLQDVEQLLEAMGASGGEAVTRPGWPFRRVGAGDGCEPSGESAMMPLRDALTSCYDIRQVLHLLGFILVCFDSR